jgi:hypothetical protein
MRDHSWRALDWRTLVQACVGVAVTASLAWGTEDRFGSPTAEVEPRLVLQGHHLIRAGEWIDLRWAEADSISELEILLSTDGGQHYSACISPELDPRQREFLWRVPPLSTGSLRLRIRFNRHGREIEGAPTSPLTVVAGTKDEPEPLGLPAGDPAGEKAPIPHGRAETPAGRASPGLPGPEGSACARKPTAASTSGHVTTTRRAATEAPPQFLAPRSIPLRA